jgi:hypothetical protein
MITKLVNAVFTVLNPRYWIMIHPYSRYCEEWCQEALKNPSFTDINDYTAYFNGKGIWIANSPYGFEFVTSGSRPSRRTVKRIEKALDRQQWVK